MSSPVFGEGGKVAESLVAQLAAVRSLASVDSLVSFETGTLNKVFRAHAAPVTTTSLAFVPSKVGSEARVGLVHLAAFRAH